jgi:vesicle-associated membrane protein-associated protein A
MSRENSNEDSVHEVPYANYSNAPQHPIASPPRPPAPELAPEPEPVPVPVRTLPVPAPAPDPQVVRHLPPPPPPSESIYHLAPAPAPTIIIKPDPELVAKVRDYEAEIQRLRATIATMSEAPPTELRRRLRTFSDAASVAETDVATVIDDSHYHHQEGVPLQVVVIIALGVFVTTYLFF